MGFWSLLEVASMPILQVLLLCILGAFMATEYLNLLPTDARRSLNKIVFIVFTPSLIFASLAESVTLQDIISWWFMPINIGLTFVFGGILGWILVKILRPHPHLEGLIIAMCSSGNLGNLLIIIVPAICDEDGSPFGDSTTCSSLALSYASFSMAIGGIYIWTFTYHLIRTSYKKLQALQAAEEVSRTPNNDLDSDEESRLLKGEDQEHVAISVPSIKSVEETEDQVIVAQESARREKKRNMPFWIKLTALIHKIVDEVLAPSTLAAIAGLIVGAVTWLRNLMVGDNAPLRVIEDSIQTLGNGTIPCLTLILGGNLTQGLRSSKIKPSVILGVVCVRYVLLPVMGIGVVRAATNFGFLSSDSLYHFVLMLQFALPPAMNIGTMAQLFDVAQDECSVILMWSYVIAVLALTVWSTVFMWILS